MDSFQTVKAKSGRVAILGGYTIPENFFFVIFQFCDDAITFAIHGFPLPKLIEEYFYLMPKFEKCKPENKKRPEYRDFSHRGSNLAILSSILAISQLYGRGTIPDINSEINKLMKLITF